MSIQRTAGDIVTHDNTITSRSLRQLEKQLAADLNQIVTKIRIHIDPLQPWYDIEQNIKPIYGQQIYDLLRAAVTDAYTLGNQYITSLKIFVNLPSYLTQTDIQQIEQLTQTYYDKFWGRVVITTNRRADKAFGIIERMQEPPDTFLNPNFIVTSIATTLTTHVLNVATLNKMRKLSQNVNPITINKNILQGAIDDDLLGEEIDELELFGKIQDTVDNINVVWVTSNDERVCPICFPLHGTKWSLNDESIPLPSFDTHQRCRCRLVIITPQ